MSSNEDHMRVSGTLTAQTEQSERPHIVLGLHCDLTVNTRRDVCSLNRYFTGTLDIQPTCIQEFVFTATGSRASAGLLSLRENVRVWARILHGRLSLKWDHCLASGAGGFPVYLHGQKADPNFCVWLRHPQGASLDCQRVHEGISNYKYDFLKKTACLDGTFTNLSAFCLRDKEAHRAEIQIFKYFSVT